MLALMAVLTLLISSVITLGSISSSTNVVSCKVKQVGVQHLLDYGVDYNETINQDNYAWYKFDRYYNYKCCPNTSIRCGVPDWIFDPIFENTLYNYNIRFPHTDSMLVPYEDVCNNSRLYRNIMPLHHAFSRGAWYRTLSR